jgi:Domain of unknown function (DUF4386)
MRSAKRAGRTVGILLLLQLAAGLTVPFILLFPLAAGSPGFLTTAAENSVQIRSSVLISFVGAVLTLSIGITGLTVFGRYSERAAHWFLAVCIISCTLDFVHAGTVMAMLSLSGQFANAAAADSAIYQVVGGVVASARRWAHYTQLAAIGAWIFTFYLSLLRFTLIPRILAVLGLLGIVSQFIGVTLSGFIGYKMISEMAMPLLPVQIIVGVWLIIKGFNAEENFEN